ncbi:MAG: hypothetical protein IJ151_00540, partial [Bacteroidales bacterium]|nr:hypothetical protein [Bacteroidales bacterium]
FDSAELHNFTVAELAAYELDMTTERDIRNFITEAKAEGRQEGEAIGLEKGRQEAAEEIAKNLLANGLDPAVIAKATGLTEEQIKVLL